MYSAGLNPGTDLTVQTGWGIQAREFCCPLIPSLTFTCHPGEQGGSLRQFITLDKQEHKTRQYKLLKNSMCLTSYASLCFRRTAREKGKMREGLIWGSNTSTHSCLPLEPFSASLLYLPLHKAATHLTGLPVALQTAVSTIRPFGVRPLCQLPVFSQSHWKQVFLEAANNHTMKPSECFLNILEADCMPVVQGRR